MIILLDADETIFDFSKAERLSISAVLSDLGVAKEYIEECAAKFSDINAECWREIEQGKMTRQEIYGHRFSRLFENYDINADSIATGMSYRRYVATHGILLDGAYEFLTALKGQGHSLYMITN
ncbi:MAG: HAD family hydrolase [Clostridia bacterium]|nr:HAD family hydrolase [Clostridia bacterium]